MTTQQDIDDLQASLATLESDYQTEEAAQGQQQADLLRQLTYAQQQLDQAIAQHTADQGQHTLDVNTIAQLQAQIAAMQQVQAPIAAFPRLAWHDEFEGSAVDTTKWNIRDHNGEGNDLSINLARNVTVDSSILTIQPHRESVTGSVSGQQVTRQYSTGYIDTHGKLAIPKPSFIELRSKLPVKPGVSAGMWPAIWFRLHTGLMEIDLMEAWGTPSLIADTSGKAQFAIGPDTNHVNVNGYHGWYDLPPQDLTQWHTYGLRIDADGTLSFRYDGAAIAFVMWVNGVRNIYPKITPSMIPGLAWDQTTDQLGLRLNLQIGQPGYYGPPNAATDFTQNYQTDHVRLWTP